MYWSAITAFTVSRLYSPEIDSIDELKMKKISVIQPGLVGAVFVAHQYEFWKILHIRQLGYNQYYKNLNNLDISCCYISYLTEAEIVLKYQKKLKKREFHIMKHSAKIRFSTLSISVRSVYREKLNEIIFNMCSVQVFTTNADS